MSLLFKMEFLMKAALPYVAFICLLLAGTRVQAQDDDALAEFARKAQDPLGDVKALMTDNAIAFDGGPSVVAPKHLAQTTPSSSGQSRWVSLLT
jgi:hypothetical protein